MSPELWGILGEGELGTPCVGSEGHRLPQGCTGVPAGTSAEGIVWISLICIFSGVWDHLQRLLRGSCCWELDGFSLPCAVCDVRALLLEELLVPAESGESLDFPAAFCNLPLGISALPLPALLSE